MKALSSKYHLAFLFSRAYTLPRSYPIPSVSIGTEKRFQLPCHKSLVFNNVYGMSVVQQAH